MKWIFTFFLVFVLMFTFVNANLEEGSLRVEQGDWVFSQDGSFIVSNETTSNSLVLFEDKFNFGDTDVIFEVSSDDLVADSRAFLVFDYVSVDDFKYAGFRVDKDQFVIGHFDGKFKDSIQKNVDIDAGEVYEIEVEFFESDVILYVNGKRKVSRDFPIVLNNVLGFGTKGTGFMFSNLEVESEERNYVARLDLSNVTGVTGTGLDDMLEIVRNDPGLIANIPSVDILEAMYYGNEMNMIILEGIIMTNIAIDDNFTVDEMKELNDYVNSNYFESWVEYHGDDEDGEETGYHLVQNDGGTTKIYGKNAVNTVIDGIFHFGFPPANDDQVQNEDGNANAKYSDLRDWLYGFLFEDFGTNKLVGNLDEANVDIEMDNIIDGGIIEFTIDVNGEIFDLRKVRIKPVLICGGVENRLRENNGYLTSYFLTSKMSETNSFSFRVSLDDFTLRIPKDEGCLFVVQLEDEFRTYLYLVEEVSFFTKEVESQRVASVSGTSIDILNHMNSALLNEIHNGYNNVFFRVKNNDILEKKFTVSLISADLGIYTAFRTNLNGQGEKELSVPIFIGENVNSGMYPVRISVSNGDEKRVKYSYLKVN